jgi:hypothetical protein
MKPATPRRAQSAASRGVKAEASLTEKARDRTADVAVMSRVNPEPRDDGVKGVVGIL